jgi:hypothetical protein
VHRSSAAVLLVLAVAGCSSTPAPAPPPAATSTTTPAPASGADPEPDLPTTPPPSPVWNDVAARAATDTAFAAMQAFVQTGRDPATWFGELAPYLTATAQAAYYGTNPTQVPAHTVTGAYAHPADTAYLALVDVGTDVGAYSLLLSREGADSGWLVERITPPAGVR